MVVCGTRERLLSASFIGTALACKTARLLRSLVSRHGKKNVKSYHESWILMIQIYYSQAMVVCGTRERLLSVSFIGTALACKAAHLPQSLLSRYGREKTK